MIIFFSLMVHQKCLPDHSRLYRLVSLKVKDIHCPAIVSVLALLDICVLFSPNTNTPVINLLLYFPSAILFKKCIVLHVYMFFIPGELPQVLG